MKDLTDREIAIIEGLSKGYINSEIAVHLGLQANTVRSRLEIISNKLKVHNRAGIVGEAYRRGILQGKCDKCNTTPDQPD